MFLLWKTHSESLYACASIFHHTFVFLWWKILSVSLTIRLCSCGERFGIFNNTLVFFWWKIVSVSNNTLVFLWWNILSVSSTSLTSLVFLWWKILSVSSTSLTRLVFLWWKILSVFLTIRGCPWNALPWHVLRGWLGAKPDYPVSLSEL